MDLSASMGTYKSNLNKAANEIADGISSLTPDYKIGFGSYVDKPLYPFDNAEDPDKQNRPK